MAQEKLIVLNGSGGAYVSITPPMGSRRVEIGEDGSVTAQGFVAQYPDDNFTTAYTYPAGSVIALGHVVGNQNAVGNVLGYNGKNVPAAYAGGTTYNVGDTALSNDTAGQSYSWVCIKNGTIGITPVTGANWNIAPNYRAADVIIKMRSATVTGTTVRAVFYE